MTPDPKLPPGAIVGASAEELQARLAGVARRMNAGKTLGDFRDKQAAEARPGEPIMLRVGEGERATLLPCRLIPGGLVLMKNGMARNPHKVRLNKKERMRERRANSEKFLREYFGKSASELAAYDKRKTT